MQRGVHEQVGAGVEAEELDVEHVRDGRQGMPGRLVRVGERPDEPGAREPDADDRMLGHVLVVVVVEERVVPNRRVEGERHEDESGRDRDVDSGGAGMAAGTVASARVRPGHGVAAGLGAASAAARLFRASA